uniref:Uncharacterized protein n=1 Tax=Melopsittacus undulatus TaxID=13146 RepID=A0A8V5H5V6_MELUD
RSHGPCAAPLAAMGVMGACIGHLSCGKEGAAPAPLHPHRGWRGAQAHPAQPPCPAGLRCALLAGLRQAPVGTGERRELERMWVLFLSALELLLQDLRRAHHLCQLFPLQGHGAALLRTGMGNRRGGGPAQPLPAPCLEEEMEQVRAMLAEMESGANIPLWTVEATQAAGTGSTTAGAATPLHPPVSQRMGPCVPSARASDAPTC